MQRLLAECVHYFRPDARNHANAIWMVIYYWQRIKSLSIFSCRYVGRAKGAQV